MSQTKNYSFSSFKDLKVTTKFVLWFLFVALIPLVTATYISYDRSRKALEDETSKSLYAIAENKAYKINTYLDEKVRNISAIAYAPEVVEILNKFETTFRKYGKASPEYSAVEKEFRPFFSYYKREFGYEDIFLTDADGNTLLSVSGNKNIPSIYEMALHSPSELPTSFIAAKRSLKPEISNFELTPNKRTSHVFIVAPILKEADFVGAVVAKLNKDGIISLFKNYDDLGKTGETIIFAKFKDSTAPLSTLRFPNEEIPGNNDHRTQGKIIRAVTKNQKTVGVFVDYRGEEVLAVLKYIPSFRLSMLVKMDTAEVFASAAQLRNTLMSISFLMLVLVLALAFVAANSISEPIKDLTRVSAKITKGNFGARAKVGAKDEIGELANSFNMMTNSLLEAKNSIEQKNVELEEQHKLLQEANKELNNFVHTASHDLMGPPIMIGAYATYLEEGMKNCLDEKSKLYLSKIQFSAGHMKHIIDDLLMLSRISRIKNPYEDVDMGSLVKFAVDRLEFEIKTSQAEIVIPPALPVVHCDRIKMGEALLNLISNAIKFSSKMPERKPQVVVSYEDKSDHHLFSVKDNGIGINKKHHQDIFEIFKRLHTQDEYPGTGAGLSIVEKIITDHNGKIWVESEPGSGATFFFTIPKDLKGTK